METAVQSRITALAQDLQGLPGGLNQLAGAAIRYVSGAAHAGTGVSTRARSNTADVATGLCACEAAGLRRPPVGRSPHRDDEHVRRIREATRC